MKFDHSLGHLINDALQENQLRRTPTRRDRGVSLLGREDSVAAMLDADAVHRIFDQAQAGDVTEMFALYRDILVTGGHIASELGKRKLAVVGDEWNVYPADEENPDDAAAAVYITNCLKRWDGLEQAVIDMLDATLYPFVVMRKQYRHTGDPRHPYCLTSLSRVEDERLSFSQAGHLQLFEVLENGTVDRSNTIPIDPEHYLVHRNHLFGSNIPDWFGGPMRSLVFWWLFSTMDRDWWVRFLDRYGAPFMLGTYPAGDEQSKHVLEAAFQWGTRIGGIVVDEKTKVEIQQAATNASADSYQKFLEVAERAISKIILGQSLSANADPTGLGSGTSNLQGEVREDIRQFDTRKLCAGFKKLFEQMLRINGIPGEVPELRFGTEDGEGLDTLGDLLSAAKAAGLQLTDEAIQIFNRRSGLEFERASAGSVPGETTPFEEAIATLSAAPDLLKSNRQIASEAAAAVALPLQIPLRGIAADLDASTDLEDLAQRLRRRLADLPQPLRQRTLEEALAAFALNADEEI